MERRIAAILASDMVGYSRLIELDEAGIIERQKRHRLEVIDPLIEQASGKIIKLTGDGLIAEFGSVVEAVQCAVTIQKEMVVRETEIPEERRIQYRIAVNLGDVIFDEGDVYGDGVNIAARLEALAEPGGVVISGTVHDLLKSQVEVGYKLLGEKQLKNIATPVRVYQVVESLNLPSTPRSRRHFLPFIGAVAIVALVILGFASWQALRPEFTPADPENFAFEIPDKPSIAVAPFENVLESGGQDWLAKGIAQSIELSLTSSSEIVAIASSAVASVPDKTPAAIAEHFGVRHVLLGTVALQGSRVRVTAQLVNTQSGQSIWADSFDRASDDLISVQDEIASSVLQELQVKLTIGEQARTWRNVMGSAENMRRFVQGRIAFQRFDAEGHETATRLWGEIVDDDANAPIAPFVQAWLLWQRVILGFTDDPVATLEEADALVDTAMASATDGNPAALKAHINLLQRDYDTALKWAKEAVKMSPSLADILMLAGDIHIRTGEEERGIELVKQGVRLEPDYPEWVHQTLMAAHLKLGQYEEVKRIAEAVLQADIADARVKPDALLNLAVVAVRKGQTDLARAHIQELLKMVPGFTREDVERKLVRERDRVLVNRYVAALVEAGLPASPPADTKRFAFDMPEKPSIAVLPFDSLSGDETLTYIGDGLAGGVVTSLGAIPQIFVIARPSSFAYRDAGRGINKIAEELGVRYVLNGSVQASGDQLRTTAELIDALSGQQVWSRQFDHDLAVEEIFEIQDQIVSDILVELDASLVRGSYARTLYKDAGDLEAYRHLVQGMTEADKFTIDGDLKALEHYQAVIDRFPASASAHSGLSWLHLNSIAMGYTADPEQSLRLAQTHAQEALDADPDEAFSHIAMANVNMVLSEYDQAIASAERALALAPSNGRVVANAGWVMSASGTPERGEVFLRSGLRSQPSPPVWVPNLLGITLFMQEEKEEAERYFEMANAIFENPSTHAHLAALAILNGDTERAEFHRSRGIAISPTTSVESHLRYWAYVRDKDHLARFGDALRDAGYPETSAARSKSD
ncbi:tetratricopeptide repeat protein [Marimonas sp. MJW-29]|uniref:Tetratricopeptide repeat protein n=1 Tax=Sulfitobacter sediminis TaxID=3234186 RepID=A0ABV3RTL5_9RHOB